LPLGRRQREDLAVQFGVAGHGVPIDIGLQSGRDRQAVLGQRLEDLRETVEEAMILLVQGG